MKNTDPLSVIYTDNFEPKEQKSNINKLAKFVEAENIASLLKEDEREEIYQETIQKFDMDYSGMSGKITQWKKEIELVCMQSDRQVPFDGASNVVYPLSSNAVLNIASKAYNAFFPDDDIYKGKVVGDDNGFPDTKDGEPMLDENGQPIMVDVGEKSKSANRASLAMNYQANNLLPNWKADTIQLFYGVFALGTMYRCEGYDPVKNRNFSRLIFPDKIIISKNASSLEDSVFSEVFYLTKNDIQANINQGSFIDYDYISSTPATDDGLSIKLDSSNITPESGEDSKYEFIKQHTWLDLDNDGYREPYCVIIDKSNQKVVKIYADYKLEGVYEKDGLIYNIERLVDLICYRCMPSFDGSFWGLGLPYFLKNINSSINTSINQLIDSMHLKIKGGGFVANDLNIRGGGLTFKMGEYKKIISLGAGSIADKFYNPPIPEPSPVMIALLEKMIASGEKIGLITDALTGNLTANMAPTTFLGLTENAASIENSMFKLLNESFIKEIKVRRRINGEYFDRDLYHRITNTKPEDVDPTADFDNEQTDIVLLTDSSNITKSQKMAKAQLFTTLIQDPFYDGLELRKKFNEAIGMPELNSIIAVPQPSPQADLILAQAEDKKAQAKLLDSEVNKIKAAADIEEKADKQLLTAADIRLKESSAIKNITDAEAKAESINIDRARLISESLYKQQDLERQNDYNTESSNNDQMV